MQKFRDVSMVNLMIYLRLNVASKYRLSFVLWVLCLFSTLGLLSCDVSMFTGNQPLMDQQVVVDTSDGADRVDAAETDGTTNPVDVTDKDADAEKDDEEEKTPRPEGWDKDTHGKKADPNYDVVFDADSVKRLDITITPEDWQAMMDSMVALYGEKNAQFEMPSWEDLMKLFQGNAENSRRGGFPTGNPEWRPCTLTFDGKTWNAVGLRFKGNSSLNATWRSGSMKMPFRLDFDRFEDDFPEIKNQRFYGFDKVSMSSNYSDSSFLREKVVADIYRDAGVPTPHTAFYRVYIDHGDGVKYFGLYTMCEIPDKPMLESQFSDNGGNLYKPDGSGATFAVYDEESYDKETNKKEADFSDIKALYDALHADKTDAAAWREGLERPFNVDGFLRWLAVNTTMVNWDTYGMMTHNFYLYNDPADTQLHWIPWDNNMAMMQGGRGMLPLDLASIGPRWPLIRFLMDDPVYFKMYVGHVKEFIETTFSPERIHPILTAAHELIRPYAVGDEGEVEGYTMLRSKEAFDGDLEFLKNHVTSRYELALEFIAENE